MENSESEAVDVEHDAEKAEKREANACIGLGLGVGAVGVGGALLSAAVCPICVVVAPGLLGAGVIKRIRIGKRRRNPMG